MIIFRNRLLLVVAVLCFGAVGMALVSQYGFDMLPCAWCVLQRLIYLVIGVVALAGACAGALLARLAAALSALLALAGIAAAWYQHDVAAKMLACDQTFADRVMSGTGLDGALPALFGIYATCMDAVVYVLGVEYALWSLMLFAVVAVLSVWALTRRQR